MFRFSPTPCIGVEITSRSLKFGVVTSKGNRQGSNSAKTMSLPPGMVVESFSSPNVKDPEGFAVLLRDGLAEFDSLRTRRVGLSIADSAFRVQSLDFDELPDRTADRDRLVRWRIEKVAAFDPANTVLRYQALPRPGRGGYSVLASMAKSEVLAQYEDLAATAGYDPWSVGPSSFNALNFYYPSLQSRGIPDFAFAWVTENTYTTMVIEHGAPRFYRCKEVRQGTASDAKDRMLRELGDSLHFYMHQDRQQPCEVGHLFLAGDTSLLPSLAEGLKGSLSLEIDVLTPRAAQPAAEGLPDSFASVLGGAA
jgi:Tfp pilus assembly PilM family ATPase